MDPTVRDASEYELVVGGRTSSGPLFFALAESAGMQSIASQVVDLRCSRIHACLNRIAANDAGTFNDACLNRIAANDAGTFNEAQFYGFMRLQLGMLLRSLQFRLFFVGMF